MASLFLNFSVLRSQAQLKGWSNRPEVPLFTRWQRKEPKQSATITTTTATASHIKTPTTNVLLLHPICRCCADVVNSVTRPSKRLVSKVTTAGSIGRKPTWDGIPSTHYMRLWPVIDEDKLREARFTANRFASFGVRSTSSPKQKEPKKNKKRGWKFWQSLV